MIPKYYEFQNSSKILSGEFALENIPSELNMLRKKKVLIILKKILEKIGTLQVVIDAISTKDIEIVGKYTEIPPDSSIEIINEITRLYKQLDCDSIVAVGGGSVIDTAKGVRMTLSQQKENILTFQELFVSLTNENGVSQVHEQFLHKIMIRRICYVQR